MALQEFIYLYIFQIILFIRSLHCSLKRYCTLICAVLCFIHIDAGVNIDISYQIYKKMAFHGLKIGQHDIYCFK